MFLVGMSGFRCVDDGIPRAEDTEEYEDDSSNTERSDKRRCDGFRCKLFGTLVEGTCTP